MVQDYESRDDEGARIFSLSDDGPEELKSLVKAMAKEHDAKCMHPDDLPGRSMTEPHAILTYCLDSLADKLAAKVDAPVFLLDTMTEPIDDAERASLREWMKTKKLV